MIFDTGIYSQDFFKKHIAKTNKLMSKIVIGLFFGVLAVFILSELKIYNYPVNYAFFVLIWTCVSSIFLFLLTKTKIDPKYFKYFTFFTLQIAVFMFSLDVNLQLSIMTMIVPIITVFYFNPLFTLLACVVSSLSSLVSTSLCAEQAIEYFWHNITPLQYLLTTGGGHLLEQIILTFILVKITTSAQALFLNLQERTLQVASMQNQIVYSFADMIESRDGTTGQHVKRSSQTVGLIVNYLSEHNTYGKKISKDELLLVSMVAPLHDIGKIVVPDAILSKPGKLTESEFEIIKTHALEGEKLIERTMKKIEDANYVKTAKEMALYHHEKWDGSGYPYHLSHEDIPIAARIMAIADVFDALCSKRSYKEPYSLDQAFTILQESKGKHFEPCLVDVMFALRPSLEKIYRGE